MFKVFRRWGVPGMLAAALAMSASPAVQAQTAVVQAPSNQGTIGTEDRIGVGLELGYPFIGAHMKYFLNSRNALQLGAGWNATQLSSGARAGFTLKAQYVGHLFRLIESSSMSVPFYLGLGLGYTFNIQEQFSVFNSDFIIGSDLFLVNVPIGVAVQLRTMPVAFFLQLEPGFDVVVPNDSPLAEADVVGNARLALGAHWFF